METPKVGTFSGIDHSSPAQMRIGELTVHSDPKLAASIDRLNERFDDLTLARGQNFGGEIVGEHLSAIRDAIGGLTAAILCLVGEPRQIAVVPPRQEVTISPRFDVPKPEVICIDLTPRLSSWAKWAVLIEAAAIVAALGCLVLGRFAL